MKHLLEVSLVDTQEIDVYFDAYVHEGCICVDCEVTIHGNDFKKWFSKDFNVLDFEDIDLENQKELYYNFIDEFESTIAEWMFVYNY